MRGVETPHYVKLTGNDALCGFRWEPSITIYSTELTQCRQITQKNGQRVGGAVRKVNKVDSPSPHYMKLTDNHAFCSLGWEPSIEM